MNKSAKYLRRMIDRVKKEFIEEGFEAVLERRLSARGYDKNQMGM